MTPERCRQVLIRYRWRIQGFQELIEECRWNGDGRVVLAKEMPGTLLSGGPDEIALRHPRDVGGPPVNLWEGDKRHLAAHRQNAIPWLRGVDE